MTKMLSLSPAVVANAQVDHGFANAMMLMAAVQSEKALVVTDAFGVIRWVTPAFCQLTEYSMNEMLGRTPGALLQGPQTNPQTVSYLSQRLKAHLPCQVRVLNYTRSGKPFHLELDIQPVFGPKHKLLGFVSYRAEALASVASGPLVQDLARIDSWQSDSIRPEHLYSARFLELLGRADLALAPSKEQMTSLVHLEDLARVRAWFSELAFAPDARHDVEYRVLSKDGQEYWLASSATRCFDPAQGRDRTIGTHQDVTYRVRSMESMKRLALTDVLTALPNRLAAKVYLQTLDASMYFGRQQAVVLLDLDDFKHVNDTFSHECGDAVLREVGHRLAQQIGPHEFAARLGGDEFMLVVHGLNSTVTSVLERLKNLRASLDAPIHWQDRVVECNVSMGVHTIARQHQSPEGLLHSADLALYEAKRVGKNCTRVYHPGMMGLDTRQHLIEQRLSQLSVVRDDRDTNANSLLVHFQPIIRALDGRLVGTEALLRWHDPRLGFVAPNEFIPIAEKSGDIRRIGLELMLNIARTLHDWNSAGGARDFRMAVNVSAAQLSDHSLFDCLQRLMSLYHFDGKQIELEITETYAVDDLKRLCRITERLRGLGVRLAIDDFGSGHSALAYLQQLPIDRIKIDRNFVENCLDSKSSHTILRGIRQITAQIGIQLTAEGVETAAQASFLRELGCDELQGFWIGAPLDRQGFSQLWLERSNHQQRDYNLAPA
jgi:diguanylate cyclase (GGDEF)-like protein/PAS domain S-box-containing protein